MVIKMWRQEWNFEGFTLRHHTPEHFTRCHWQNTERVTPLWIVYRAVVALCFFVFFLYTIVPWWEVPTEENRQKYLIFLTHWTFLVELIQFVLAFIIVVERAFQENKSSLPLPMTKMPYHYRIYWVFFTIALPSAFVVSLIFWTCVYDPEYFPVNGSSLIEHVFNSIFIVIDLCLVGHPVRFLHIYWPLLYGFTYMFFTIIYQLSGGKGVKGIIPVYKILDWRQPTQALITCSYCVALLVFFYSLGCCFSLFKFWIKSKLHPKLGSPRPESD